MDCINWANRAGLELMPEIQLENESSSPTRAGPVSRKGTLSSNGSSRASRFAQAKVESGIGEGVAYRILKEAVCVGGKTGYCTPIREVGGLEQRIAQTSFARELEQDG